MFPRARTDNLTVRKLPDETLVYDHQRHKAHCLNTTAALVWRHSDGHTSTDELARLVSAEMGIPDAAEVVALALEQLGRRHLLNEAPQPPTDRVSRRDALKALVAAAVALPLVMTVATRAAAQSISAAEKPTPAVVIQPELTIDLQQSPRQSKAKTVSDPCRTKGQSCLATVSGQQGTCCPGLKCNNVYQNAGVCS